MSRATQEDLEKIIRTTGFFRNKSKSIRGASERLVEAFGGTVPRTMEELLTLPGVARKTANVVLGVGHGVAEGIVVDTHVERLSRRLGLSRAKNPVEIERDLMRQVPRDQWILFSHLLIFHGRRVCTARKPQCGACAVFEYCPSGPYYVRGKVPPWDRRAAAARKKAAPARKASAAKGGARRRPARKGAERRSPRRRAR
jgi:endonuclease-3